MAGYYMGGNDPAFGGGAAYPGLGTISAYGFGPDGRPALGPYAFMGQSRPSMGIMGSLLTRSPTDTAASKFLNQVISGQQLPMGTQQQNAMLAQQSAMSAAAEAQQNASAQQAASQGGASASDPSLQGVYRQNAAARQGANQRAAGNIAAQANMANFGAQANAAGAMLRHGEAEDALNSQESMFNRSLANAQSQQALGYLSNYLGGMSGRQGIYDPSSAWGN